ncbi:MAG: OmpH family outer membrane protein [Bacteroidota bacterium]
MKNFKKLFNRLVIINIILALAVIALFVLMFTGVGRDISTTVTQTEDSGKQTSKSQALGAEDSVIAERIAVVKLDTLLTEYKLAQVMNEDLMERQKKAEANLQQKMSKFEKDYKKFQEKAEMGSFLSEASMQAQQQELMEQQQEIQELNQKLTMELSEEQERMTQGLYDSVLNYMPEINDGRFVLILGDAVGTNVLYSNDAMDITNEVVSYLNDKYEGNNKEEN